MKVVAGWHASPMELDRVRRALPVGTEVVTLPGHDAVAFPYGADRAAYLEAMRDADAVITWVLPHDVVRAAPKLAHVSWLHAGCDRLPFDEFRARGITLANVPDAHQAAIAEHAWALVLAAVKRIVWKHGEHVAGRHVPYWRDGGVGGTLSGSTLAVLGVGSIGAQIARVAHAFDMHVVGVRRNGTVPHPHVDRMYGEHELHLALAQADVVVIAVPSTARTRGLIDAEALAALRPGAVVVNIARGDIVVEEAVRDALDEGRVGVFASDVWWDYEDAMPPDQHFGSPSRLGVHLRDDVIVSGDQASNVYFARDRMLDRGLENLADMIAGLTPRGAVDLDEEY
ncbi:NAD(P)-dependent oxidoreductase [Microbacterium ulmi]|uniref:Phosphoglycerate dehydrogenase n=1 Tax=Microbacterium ulmi TaxID=179095 RepID=A0A7Y2LY91_9MICO|nr:NAD(P)-dependent oxidoreductase [Microbacterium ulmi]NII68432.1 phosphoglycerate dehydrogenase-like enzyme [Microbacterium ulmi]NNH03045.1 phosphoglycerate dehydrogenase [Microbacterium ulmi]